MRPGAASERSRAHDESQTDTHTEGRGGEGRQERWTGKRRTWKNTEVTVGAVTFWNLKPLKHKVRRFGEDDHGWYRMISDLV